MAERTSATGTSYTRRNAPILGASTKGTRPSFAFLSQAIAPTTGSTSIAAARTGSPSASSRRSCRATVCVAGDAETPRQAGLGDHAQRDRLAVGEALVPRGGLERVTDRVAVVEHVSQLGLALVALDDSGLEPAGSRR